MVREATSALISSISKNDDISNRNIGYEGRKD